MNGTGPALSNNPLPVKRNDYVTSVATDLTDLNTSTDISFNFSQSLRVQRYIMFYELSTCKWYGDSTELGQAIRTRELDPIGNTSNENVYELEFLVTIRKYLGTITGKNRKVFLFISLGESGTGYQRLDPANFITILRIFPILASVNCN